MNEPMEISMAFITETDRYFFERRTKSHANGALGKIGCWGGQINKGETSLEAIVREVTQEEVSGLEDYSADKFWQLSDPNNPLRVDSDRDEKPVEILAHVFKLLLPIGYMRRIHAPSSIWLNLPQLQNALDSGRLTPATEKACIEYLGLSKTEAV